MAVFSQNGHGDETGMLMLYLGAAQVLLNVRDEEG